MNFHRGTIALLTDFGEQDGFVGTMKGVISKISPNSRIIDISHQIPAHNINAAAFVLHAAHSFFPEGTIHVIVVDPGVGSARRIIACSANRQIFLAPDNAVLKYIFQQFKIDSAVCVSNEKYFLNPVSHTFHGRDIFAPVAAHLSAGVKLPELGEPISDFERGKLSLPTISENSIQGQIIYIDKFGNLITNITRRSIPESVLNNKIYITCNQFEISGIMNSYAAAVTQGPLAIWGSYEYLEIAVNQDKANEMLKMTYDNHVVIRWK